MHLVVTPMENDDPQTAAWSIKTAEIRAQGAGREGAVTFQAGDLIFLGFFLLEQPDLASLIPAQALLEKGETCSAAHIAEPVYRLAAPVT